MEPAPRVEIGVENICVCQRAGQSRLKGPREERTACSPANVWVKIVLNRAYLLGAPKKIGRNRVTPAQTSEKRFLAIFRTKYHRTASLKYLNDLSGWKVLLTRSRRSFKHEIKSVGTMRPIE